MNKGRQLRLPKLGNIEKIKRERLFPQPHVGKAKGLKKFEILHRPFDLRFRGKIRNWLEFIKVSNVVNLEEILDEFQRRIIRLYFYPQKPEGKWLNQMEVIIKVKLISKKKLKTALVDSLLQTWLKIK